ncbi:MAG: hypothetical protein ACXAC6_04530 [Candidatus Hodarchaeales archaeon]
MDRIYRVLIGGFLAFTAVVFLILAEIFRADSAGSSTTSGPDFFPLTAIIAILVVIVVPAIFVVVRLIRR